MTILLIILAIVALIYLALIANVKRIQRFPNKYPLSEIEKDPVGKEIYITQKDGTKIRTIVAGEGQPIVLAHGYAASLVEWNIISKQLVEAGYKVIMFDQRGHMGSTIGSEGISTQSMASVYRDVLQHYDVRNGILVGHSMGGFLSIAFMLNNPGVVRKRLKAALIMASFAGDILKDNPQNKLQIPLIKSGLLTSAAKTKLLGYPFGRSTMGEKPDSAMIEVFLDVFIKIKHRQLVPILEAFGNESYYDRLGEIKIPCTIMVGTKDATTPPFHTNDMVKGISNARLVKLEGKGHMLNWEAADEVTDEILTLARTNYSNVL